MPETKSNVKTLKTDIMLNQGIDTDPQDDPTYPMRNRFEGDNKGFNWERPALQEETVEVLQSTEYPGRTAVFGTSVPPRGLSGMLRRKAYTYSESSFYRWLPLILADRVDMVEGMVEDLLKGYIPNIWKEKGMSAGMRHNPEGTVKRMVIKGGIITLVTVAAVRHFKRK